MWMGIFQECHRSRTPASAASASHDLWDCCEELVPRPMQPHHADGQFWPATIAARLRMAYGTRLGSHSTCTCILCTCTVVFSVASRGVLPNARDVTFCPLVCLGFFPRLTSVKGTQLAWHDARCCWGRFQLGACALCL